MGASFGCSYRLPPCSRLTFIKVKKVNLVTSEREKFGEVVHFINDFIEPADFMDEEDLHSLGVFMPSLAIDVPGVALDQFGNSP